MYLKRVVDDTSPDNTQPLTDFEKGQDIYVDAHIVDVGGTKLTMGDHPGKFTKAYEQNGTAYGTVYHQGFRTYELKWIRAPGERGAIDTPVDEIRGGDIMIKCEGLPDQPCDNMRMVHASDRHLVKRCKDCQKEWAKLQTRLRMRKRRAEARKKKAAAEAKEAKAKKKSE
jgi:hypothetical protein